MDDQAAFRSLMRQLVEATSGLTLVGEADSGEAAIELVAVLAPDLVLMDVRMPGIGGIGATRQIKSMRPATVVTLISTTHPHRLRLEADECGADDVVWKADLRPSLLEQIWRRHAVGANSARE